MPLNEQKGDMYNWVTHTWNTIKGKCPHDCNYCYMKRFPQKDIRLDKSELKTDLGSGNTIFVGSSCDIFAEDIPDEWIKKTLDHCEKYPDNTYLFQSKNPSRFTDYYFFFPIKTILGTTLESNKNYHISKAPSVIHRAHTMKLIGAGKDFKTMISVEPLLNFDLEPFIKMIKDTQPLFVSIGADSKGHYLPEPNKQKTLKLITELKKSTRVKIKDNLRRIIK